MTGLIVDGVPHTPATIRRITRERHQLAQDVNDLRHLLRLRTAALHRVSLENEALRATQLLAVAEPEQLLAYEAPDR